MKTLRKFLKWTNQFDSKFKGLVYDEEHGVWRGVFARPNPAYDGVIVREVPPDVQVSRLVRGLFLLGD